MSFYELFFQEYSKSINQNSEWPLVDENKNLIIIKASTTIISPIEFPEFLPCYCDAGHPYLFALSNSSKKCQCTGPTYIKILERSDIAVSSLLVRGIGVYCINGHKTKTSWPDSSVAEASLSCSSQKHK